MPPLATVVATSAGAGAEQGTRRFVIDFVGKPLADLKPDASVEAVITTSAGTVQQPIAQPNSPIGGWRVSFVLLPGDTGVCDLRCVLKLGETLLSEVWMYRWTL
jgi:glucans biosynthesis protein